MKIQQAMPVEFSITALRPLVKDSRCCIVETVPYMKSQAFGYWRMNDMADLPTEAAGNALDPELHIFDV